jgi:hypothetical protein
MPWLLKTLFPAYTTEPLLILTHSGPKNAGSMFLWNDSIYPPDKCHIPEDHTLCNTTNYCVS